MTTGKTEVMDEAKRKRLEAAGWQTGDYGDFLGLSDEERAIVELRLEIQRLEREVIEAAKEWPANYEREELLNDSIALTLFDAVTALEFFEAKQNK